MDEYLRINDMLQRKRKNAESAHRHAFVAFSHTRSLLCYETQHLAKMVEIFQSVAFSTRCVCCVPERNVEHNPEGQAEKREQLVVPATEGLQRRARYFTAILKQE